MPRVTWPERPSRIINNPAMDYGPCGSDYRNIVNVSTGHQKQLSAASTAWRGWCVNDWELAPLMHITSGAPVNVTTGGDVSLTDVGNDRPNLVAGVNRYAEVKFQNVSTAATRQYLNPAAFAYVCPKNNTTGCAAAGTYGNISRNEFRAPPYFNIDAQISRIFPIHESFAMNLRWKHSTC